MRSGWFWQTGGWAAYEQSYWEARVNPIPWKSSPLAADHDFSDLPAGYHIEEHRTQVLDLSQTTADLDEIWTDVRKSYRPLINHVLDRYQVEVVTDIIPYRVLHAEANGGAPRSPQTYFHQDLWLAGGTGLLVGAQDYGRWLGFCYWILWKHAAYWMSGPSIEKNVMHGIMWESLLQLKKRGIALVELGQTDGETPKEQAIGFFKTGFSGTTVPYFTVRRTQ